MPNAKPKMLLVPKLLVQCIMDATTSNAVDFHAIRSMAYAELTAEQVKAMSPRTNTFFEQIAEEIRHHRTDEKFSYAIITLDDEYSYFFIVTEIYNSAGCTVTFAGDETRVEGFFEHGGGDFYELKDKEIEQRGLD